MNQELPPRPILVQLKNKAHAIAEWDVKLGMYISIREFGNDPEGARKELQAYLKDRKICAECNIHYQHTAARSKFFCGSTCASLWAEREIQNEGDEE